LVTLEGEHKLRIVESERIGRINLDRRVRRADGDVLIHDLLSLVCRQPVPLAHFRQRVDEQVFV
jgi:hypothetical protein